MARAVYEQFADCAVMIIGDTPNNKRQEAVDAFQNREDVRLFVGNIQAAGVGITLTASSHVVFGELSWVPGEITQAEDRCHRIGQKDSVFVQHLVLAGSLDQLIAKVIVYKQNIIDQAVNTEVSSRMIDALK